MKYYYQSKNGKWKQVGSHWKLRCVCSIMGTKTWCIDDCPLEDKHETPEVCKEHKLRRGFKELCWLLGGLISVSSIAKVYFYLTFNAWIYINTEGVANGKTAKFKIAIITQEYKWKIASTDSIETGLIDRELPSLLNNLKDFDKNIGTIAVGTASQEGENGREIKRADERADKITLILRTHNVSKNRNLYKLNLGQYSIKDNSKNVVETATERRVILIGIVSADENMEHKDLQQALKDALEKPELQKTINTKNYSNFDFLIVK